MYPNGSRKLKKMQNVKTKTIDPDVTNIYAKAGLYDGDGAICLRFTDQGETTNVVMPVSYAMRITQDLIRAIENVRPDLGYTVFAHC